MKTAFRGCLFVAFIPANNPALITGTLHHGGYRGGFVLLNKNTGIGGQFCLL